MLHVTIFALLIRWRGLRFLSYICCTWLNFWVQVIALEWAVEWFSNWLSTFRYLFRRLGAHLLDLRPCHNVSTRHEHPELKSKITITSSVFWVVVGGIIEIRVLWSCALSSFPLKFSRILVKMSKWQVWMLPLLGNREIRNCQIAFVIVV